MTEEVYDLEDLTAGAIRRSNDHVDEAMSDLEDEVDELRTQLDEAEQAKEAAEEEAEQANELLERFRDNQRQSRLDRIAALNDEVADEEEVGVDAIEDASIDTLDWVIDRLETFADATDTEVSNAGNDPDLSNVDDDEGDDFESALEAKADEFGLGRSYKKLQSDDFGGPQGLQTGSAGNDMDAAEALREIINGGGS